MGNIFVNNAKKTNYEYKLAKIASVGNYKATLIFAGETTASTKQYRANYWYNLHVGDKVIVQRIGGTYQIVGKYWA